MEYRNLGRTGVKVSPLCLGCMMFGRGATAEESFTIVDRALDAGIKFLDDLIRAGKILYAGASTFGAWQLMDDADFGPSKSR